MVLEFMKVSAKDFDGNRKDLIDLITEFHNWVNLTLEEHETIAVVYSQFHIPLTRSLDKLNDTVYGINLR
jgi:hypothetical protein